MTEFITSLLGLGSSMEQGFMGGVTAVAKMPGQVIGSLAPTPGNVQTMTNVANTLHAKYMTIRGKWDYDGFVYNRPENAARKFFVQPDRVVNTTFTWRTPFAVKAYDRLVGTDRTEVEFTLQFGLGYDYDGKWDIYFLQLQPTQRIRVMSLSQVSLKIIPQHQPTLDRQGSLHLTWIWEETNDLAHDAYRSSSEIVVRGDGPVRVTGDLARFLDTSALQLPAPAYFPEGVVIADPGTYIPSIALVDPTAPRKTGPDGVLREAEPGVDPEKAAMLRAALNSFAMEYLIAGNIVKSALQGELLVALDGSPYDRTLTWAAAQFVELHQHWEWLWHQYRDVDRTATESLNRMNLAHRDPMVYTRFYIGWMAGYLEILAAISQGLVTHLLQESQRDSYAMSSWQGDPARLTKFYDIGVQAVDIAGRYIRWSQKIGEMIVHFLTGTLQVQLHELKMDVVPGSGDDREDDLDAVDKVTPCNEAIATINEAVRAIDDVAAVVRTARNAALPETPAVVAGKDHITETVTAPPAPAPATRTGAVRRQVRPATKSQDEHLADIRRVTKRNLGLIMGSGRAFHFRMLRMPYPLLVVERDPGDYADHRLFDALGISEDRAVLSWGRISRHRRPGAAFAFRGRNSRNPRYEFIVEGCNADHEEAMHQEIKDAGFTDPIFFVRG